ncbi:MAG: hypothetical protein BMS9Abin19_0313 [Gammaproteobacteria bacterium]|nr:MAG: hypothetical protein BMS9Abin19_0313 [Gammaproteobacteria bacterium]
MKQLIRTILIWTLTLSGLPVIAQSQALSDLKQTDKNVSLSAPGTQASDAQATDMHCHSAAALIDKNIRLATQVASEAGEKIVTSSHDDCCCGSDCQCDTACQSVHASSVSALLQSGLFISSPIIYQVVIESSILYLNFDSGLEKIPPIV